MVTDLGSCWPPAGAVRNNSAIRIEAAVCERARIGLPPFSAGQSNPSQRRVSTEDSRRQLTTKDAKITKEEFSRKGAKAAKGKRFLRSGRSLLRVMLNGVKH